MSDLVLFDMDGTLTEARQPIDFEMEEFLTDFGDYADWGVITGSGFDYLTQQMSSLFKREDMNFDGVHLLPCNGTQHYTWNYEKKDWQCILKKSMREELSNDNFEYLIYTLISIQKWTAKNLDIPLTGHFISDRGSTVNWCPIGREANLDQREKFIEADKRLDIRKNARSALVDLLKSNSIEVEIALGGQTSLDIYPAGWDKTYGLQHFPNQHVWFVGDKCTSTGNDRTIYEKISKFGRSFETSGPENTLSLLKDSILPVIISNE